MPETPLQRLQELLREIFQFDSADLDFGLYRLLHLKRREIEAFLTDQLPRQVNQAFASAASAERAALEKELAECAERIKEDVSEYAIGPTGEPNPEFANIKSVQQYQVLREKLAVTTATVARQAEVFNHLYNFFSRYYEDGDFIPRRRYGATETYAVPYDGQEVFFHWATRDMHYVKTAETLKDYAFTVQALGGPYRVRFVLVEASVPKDNVKGDRRFFFPRPDLAEYDQTTREFRLPFEYRPPTEQEAADYGTNARAQEAISTEAVESILSAVSNEMLRAALAADQRTEQEKADDRPELPLILKRLRHFTRRQTSDFFIHKDLRGFLRRELEFYIKDQVLNLMDIEGDLEAKRRMIRVLRRLGEDLIEFLSQIEDAQKRLFEKKKFIIETHYCITVGNIREDFYDDIADCDAQWQEWKDLFHIDEEQRNLFTPRNKRKRRVEFLKGHPTLVLDTRHFSRDFVDRLLASFDDLEEMTDGLLVHGENYQALRLLQERFCEQIKCIYIDPPYNTDASPILYKNNYRSSTWVSMIGTRLGLTRPFLRADGLLAVAIDDFEQKELHFLLETIFGKENILATVVVRSNPSGRPGTTGFSTSHDYVVFAARTPDIAVNKLTRTAEHNRRYKHTDRKGSYMWELLRKRGSGSERKDSPKLYYPLYVSAGAIRVPKMRWDELKREWIVLEQPQKGEVPAYPIDEDGIHRRWRWSLEHVRNNVSDLKAVTNHNGQITIYYKYRPPVGVPPTTLWTHAKYSATEHGTNLLKSFFQEYDPFSFPKAVYAVRDALVVMGSMSGAWCLDYFAGSGTTGHAVINLNREDGGLRKFILVEMADYFETVLLPRIKKVTFSPEWKEGKPKRMATAEEAERSPRIVKYVRLESYEDALHNVASDGTQERAVRREEATKEVVGEDQYRLKYLVRLPLEAAETMLSVAKLDHPFDYTLEILTEQGPRQQPVDLIETFNYLYGLRVRQLATWVNTDDKTEKEKDGRAYRIVRATDRDERRRILVIWRDMTGLDPEKERAFLEEKIKTESQTYDEVLINGDTATSGVASLDGLFKRLMMAGEEQAS